MPHKPNEKYIEPIMRYQFNTDNIKTGDAIRITNTKDGNGKPMTMLVTNIYYTLSQNEIGRSFEVYDMLQATDIHNKAHKFRADEFAGNQPTYKLEVLT